jgi:hypothetical protein
MIPELTQVALQTHKKDMQREEPNYDLDSGKETKAVEYSLAEETYAKLVAQLAESKFDHTTLELRDNILQFYSDVSASNQTTDGKIESTKMLGLLNQLRAATPVSGTDAVAARYHKISHKVGGVTALAWACSSHSSWLGVMSGASGN